MTARRSILLVNSLYHPRVTGGAERSVQFLAESLAAAGHRVTVATLSPESEPARAELNGVAIEPVPVANLYWPFGAKARGSSALFHAIDMWNPAMESRFGALLDRVRPDVIHTNVLVGFSAAVWRAARKRGVPVLHTLRDFYLLCPKAQMFKNGRNCETPCFVCSAYSVAKRRLSRFVTGVVGNSRFILEKHLANGFFARAKVRTVIHNAYALGASPPAPRSTGNQKPLRLGYLGRLDEYKGVTLLLEAVSRSPAAEIELLLAGAGEPGYEEALRQRFAGSNIRFAGFVKPEKVFSQIDALVAPALWHEPLPRTVFEGYAHGVPVIASNRGGLPELVEEGRTGWMFDPAEPDSLRHVLQRGIAEKNSLAGMRGACLEKAKSFLPEVIAGQYLAAYDAVTT